MTMPISKEERMVPIYRDVLNNPEATPIISFGELWNKPACKATLTSPLLNPKAANAMQTLRIGDDSFNVTIHAEPRVIRRAETSKAGLGPDLSTHRPAIGDATSEHKPKLSINSPE